MLESLRAVLARKNIYLGVVMNSAKKIPKVKTIHDLKYGKIIGIVVLSVTLLSEILAVLFKLSVLDFSAILFTVIQTIFVFVFFIFGLYQNYRKSELMGKVFVYVFGIMTILFIYFIINQIIQNKYYDAITMIRFDCTIIGAILYTWRMIKINPWERFEDYNKAVRKMREENNEKKIMI
jgi:hypothetical protein